MKRIFLLIALVGMMAVGMSAQSRSLATLSHDGELTFFDKLSCFEDALEAAQPGDIIYLSSGTFGTDISKTISIKKPIRIIGNGYDSHIVSNLQLYKESGDTLTWTYSSSAPFCDGVRLEKLSFYSYTSSNFFDQVEITASRIKELSNTNSDVKNLIVDRSFIETYHSSSSSKVNTEFRNSKIKVLDARENELVVNCNIDSIYAKPGFIKSSIIRTISYNSPSSRLENCLVGNVSLGYNYTDLVNCYDLTGTDTKVLDENMEAVVDLQQNGYFGTDGTVVGIYGGDWLPYSESPTVPAVKASASSVKYDPEKNQLDVNITVAE